MDFTFTIDIARPNGIATVYTDDLAEFITAMDCDVIKGATRAINSAELKGLPVLAGYIGPRLIERSPDGVPVVQYRALQAVFNSNQYPSHVA